MKSPSEIPFNPVRRSVLTACLVLCLSVLLAVPSPAPGAQDQEVRQAVALLEEGAFERALEMLLAIRSAAPDPAGFDRLVAFAYLGTGYRALAAGDFPAAREAFQEGRRYAGDDARFLQGEASLLYRQARYAEAAALLDQAVGIDPDSAELFHELGLARYADGRMAEALDALDRAVELGGGEAVAELREKVRREWRYERELGQETRGHFQLSYVEGGEEGELARDVLESLEGAYVEMGASLAFYPEIKVPVLLYARREFAALTGSPDWAGGVYDGKIRLPLGGVTAMTPEVEALLYHEYTHVLVHLMANRNAPTWLNEGLAELAGRQRYAPPLQKLPGATAAGRLLAWDDLAGPFAALPGDSVLLAYEQSWSLTRFMVDSYGWHKLGELLAALGGKRPWREAVAAVYADYGLDWPAILAEWRAVLE